MTWSGWLRRRRAAAYGAGPGLDDALEACRRLAAYGMRSTVGYSAPAGERPRAVADVQLAAFDRLARENLGLREAVRARLRPSALRRARRRRRGVRTDPPRRRAGG